MAAAREPDASTRTLRSGFLRSRAHYPDHIAVEVAGQALTYIQLYDQAAALANTLERHALPRDEEGESLTAIFGQRSVAACAGILGALFQGDGYVPLNPSFPIERTRNMLERSGARTLIIDSSGESQLEGLLEGIPSGLLLIFPERRGLEGLERFATNHTLIPGSEFSSPEGWEPRTVDPNAIAYLLFTSGSTGAPKGVMVAHRNVTGFLDAMCERYSVGPDDRLSQTFDLTFDLSIFDLFLAWESGARVCIPSQAQKMLPAKYIQESGLTIWFSVPSTALLMNKLHMLKPDRYPSLRWSLFCGEALPVETVESWTQAAPNSICENLYGPTELTIACTFYRWDPHLSPDLCEKGLVPIGEPSPGMEVLVANESLRPVAPGEAGELLMTGPQLTPGYWKDPSQTAEAFVIPPSEERTFYRTGDQVRRATDERPMAYLGRLDDQVKIQGYRVELGEVEAIIREEASVETAIALGWPETAAGADSILVFISDRGADLDAVNTRARRRLPAYMAPRELRHIDQFPLNSNGKIDRRMLRALLLAEG